MRLQVGGDIREEDIIGTALVGEEVRGEIGEDVESEADRVADVHVLVIAAVPAEGRTVTHDHSAQIDAAFLEQPAMLAFEIAADGGNDADRRKEARGERKETGGTAECLGHSAVLRVDGVVTNRADYNNAHAMFTT